MAECAAYEFPVRELVLSRDGSSEGRVLASLGLSLSHNRPCGVKVSAVVADSPAERAGCISVGDVIVLVNDEKMLALSYFEVTTAIATAGANIDASVKLSLGTSAQVREWAVIHMGATNSDTESESESDADDDDDDEDDDNRASANDISDDSSDNDDDDDDNSNNNNDDGDDDDAKDTHTKNPVTPTASTPNLNNDTTLNPTTTATSDGGGDTATPTATTQPQLNVNNESESRPRVLRIRRAAEEQLGMMLQPSAFTRFNAIITEVKPDTAVAFSNAQVNDVIVSVNGKPMLNLTMKQVVDEIKAIGTSFTLGVVASQYLQPEQQQDPTVARPTLPSQPLQTLTQPPPTNTPPNSSSADNNIATTPKANSAAKPKASPWSAGMKAAWGGLNEIVRDTRLKYSLKTAMSPEKKQMLQQQQLQDMSKRTTSTTTTTTPTKPPSTSSSASPYGEIETQPQQEVTDQHQQQQQHQQHQQQQPRAKVTLMERIVAASGATKQAALERTTVVRTASKNLSKSVKRRINNMPDLDGEWHAAALVKDSGDNDNSSENNDDDDDDNHDDNNDNNDDGDGDDNNIHNTTNGSAATDTTTTTANTPIKDDGTPNSNDNDTTTNNNNNNNTTTATTNNNDEALTDNPDVTGEATQDQTTSASSPSS